MIRSSLVWLGIGVSIGVSMAFWPGSHIIYIPAHTHANLLGFMSMMIFGVGYHVLPRFSGRALTSPRLAMVHVWVANIGLALQVGGFIARPHMGQPGSMMVGIGGSLSALGAFFFIYNIWTTLGTDDRQYTTVGTRRSA